MLLVKSRAGTIAGVTEQLDSTVHVVVCFLLLPLARLPMPEESKEKKLKSSKARHVRRQSLVMHHKFRNPTGEDTTETSTKFPLISLDPSESN